MGRVPTSQEIYEALVESLERAPLQSSTQYLLARIKAQLRSPEYPTHVILSKDDLADIAYHLDEVPAGKLERLYGLKILTEDDFPSEDEIHFKRGTALVFKWPGAEDFAGFSIGTSPND